MTPEQINIEIAQLRGWTDCRNDGEGTLTGTPPLDKAPPNTINYSYKESQRYKLPDYYGDLNEMHEAEKMLTIAQRAMYNDWLTDNTAGVSGIEAWTWHATAAQRAEAFLRVFNKWK